MKLEESVAALKRLEKKLVECLAEVRAVLGTSDPKSVAAASGAVKSTKAARKQKRVKSAKTAAKKAPKQPTEPTASLNNGASKTVEGIMNGVLELLRDHSELAKNDFSRMLHLSSNEADVRLRTALETLREKNLITMRGSRRAARYRRATSADVAATTQPTPEA
ncbi:MAG: hypothetical protein ACHREM_09155 [Polyangiales bacterium]